MSTSVGGIQLAVNEASRSQQQKNHDTETIQRIAHCDGSPERFFWSGRYGGFLNLFHKLTNLPQGGENLFVRGHARREQSADGAH